MQKKSRSEQKQFYINSIKESRARIDKIDSEISALNNKIKECKSNGTDPSEHEKEKESLDTERFYAQREIYRDEHRLDAMMPRNMRPLDCELCSRDCGYCGKCVYEGEAGQYEYEYYSGGGRWWE